MQPQEGKMGGREAGVHGQGRRMQREGGREGGRLFVAQCCAFSLVCPSKSPPLRFP